MANITVAELQMLLTMRDNASAELRKAEQQVGSFGSTLNKASLIATGAFAAAMGISTKLTMDFGKGISDVGAIAQASGPDLEALRETALRIGKDTAFSASEATAAMKELAAGGVETADILGGAADAAVALAAAGGTDLATAATVAASALDAWGMSAAELPDVVNRIAGAANVSKFGVEDMAGAFGMASGVAAQMGVSMADTSTAIAAVASSFSSGSDAGTSFKTFLLALDPTVEKSKQLIADYGLRFREADGSMRPMAEIAEELRTKIGTLGEAQQVQALKTIFGNDAYRTAAGLMKLGGDEFTAMSTKLRDTSAADVAAARMDNLAGDVEELKGSLETAAITMGAKADPALRAMASGASEAVEAFLGLPESTQNLTLMIVGLTAAAPLAVTGIGKLATGVSNLGSVMGTTQGKVMGMTLAIGALTLAGDALLQKTTGHGLMEWIFGDPRQADATNEAISRLEIRLKELGPEVDRVSLGLGMLADAHVRNNEAQERAGVTSAMVAKLSREEQAAIDALVKSVGGQTASYDELSRIRGALDEAETDYFDKQVNWTEQVKAHTQAVHDAAVAEFQMQDSLQGTAQAAEPAAKGIESIRFSAQDVANYMGGWGPLITSAIGEVDAEKLKTISATEFPDFQMSAAELEAYLSETFAPEAGEAFKELYDKAKENLDKTTEAIKGILPATDETFAEWKKRLDQMAKDQANFGSNLELVYKAISDAGVEMPELITRAIGQKGPAFAAEFAKHFKEDPETAIEALKLAAPILMGETGDAIVAKLAGFGDNVELAIATGFVDPMKSGIKAGEPQVAEQARLLMMNAAMVAEVEARTGGGRVAVGLDTGVAAGLESSSAAIAAASAYANKVIATLKATLGIQSPSRVAAEEIGIPITEGIAAGIAEGGGIVSAAIAGLAQAAVESGVRGVMQGLAGGSSGGSTGPQPWYDQRTGQTHFPAGTSPTAMFPILSHGLGYIPGQHGVVPQPIINIAVQANAVGMTTADLAYAVRDELERVL